MDQRRIGLRDAGLRRLQRLTTTAAAGAGVLAFLFAGLAAKAFPGRSSHTAAVSVTRVAPKPRRPRQSPPPVVSIGFPSRSAPPPASAPTAPAPTSAAPTVVSGGS